MNNATITLSDRDSEDVAGLNMQVAVEAEVNVDASQHKSKEQEIGVESRYFTRPIPTLFSPAMSRYSTACDNHNTLPSVNITKR